MSTVLHENKINSIICSILVTRIFTLKDIFDFFQKKVNNDDWLSSFINSLSIFKCNNRYLNELLPSSNLKDFDVLKKEEDWDDNPDEGILLYYRVHLRETLLQYDIFTKEEIDIFLTKHNWGY